MYKGFIDLMARLRINIVNDFYKLIQYRLDDKNSSLT